MNNSQKLTREESELAFLNDVKSFFENVEHTFESVYSPFSVRKCRDFFQYVEPIISGTWSASALDIDTVSDNLKSFFEKAQGTIAQVLLPETPSLKECQEFFLNAERVTTQPQAPIEKFEEFCKNAYPSLLKQYRRWIAFIEKNNIGGFQNINLLKVFGISGKEEAHSKFLVWLMKEDESHGLGNAFLKKFMDAVTKKYPGTKSLRLEGVIVIPKASGEHGTPDIKIKGKDFLCIVENKIRAIKRDVLV